MFSSTVLTVVMGIGSMLFATSCGTESVTTDATSSTVGPSAISSNSSGPETPSSPTRSAAEPVQPCTNTELQVALGDQTERRPGEQVVLALRFTNGSAHPCTTEGYPGATLEGPDDPKLGPHFVLTRSTKISPEPLTLAPGRTAIAELTAMVATAANGWLPDRLLTTAPDDTVTVALPWPADLPVPRQDGATRPATYVGPLTG